MYQHIISHYIYIQYVQNHCIQEAALDLDIILDIVRCI